MKRIIFKRTNGQRGMASIIIVTVLVMVLSLIAIGFSRLMNRSINRTVNNQLSEEASYAAESALNDVVSYLRAQPNPSQVKASGCNDLINNPNFISYVKTVSLSGADNITKYTCLLVHPSTGDLVFQNVPAYKSQVVELTTSSKIDKLMISWSSSNGKNSFPASGTTLFDETTWDSRNYAPLLRATIYPMPPVGTTLDTSVETNSKTVYLYPNNDPSNTATNQSYASVADGSIIPVNCSTAAAKSAPGFAGTPTSDCNLVINGMTASGADHYYLRLTPVYGAADLRIQADGSGNLLQFTSQTAIDVTAKANNAVKRLQARVELSAGNNINPNADAVPENSVRTSNTLCKRLNVESSQVTVQTGSDPAFCSL